MICNIKSTLSIPKILFGSWVLLSSLFGAYLRIFYVWIRISNHNTEKETYLLFKILSLEYMINYEQLIFFPHWNTWLKFYYWCSRLGRQSWVWVNSGWSYAKSFRSRKTIHQWRGPMHQWHQNYIADIYQGHGIKFNAPSTSSTVSHTHSLRAHMPPS